MGIRTKPKNRTPHNKNKRTKKEDSTPINEHLVRILVRKSKTTAESIQVRLLVDQGRDEKPLIEVMSLTHAIGMSGEEGVDLVGINLNQDVPVVKCIDFNKFLYQQSKKGSSVKNPNAGKKSTKQFTFKAGIDDNDLQRKTDNMIGYLTKGHACQVTITSKGRFLKVDKDIVETTLERLKELVGDDGNPQGNMKKNEWGNRGSLLFQPNSKKKQT
jgi:translation initiation factor IF-3